MSCQQRKGTQRYTVNLYSEKQVETHWVRRPVWSVSTEDESHEMKQRAEGIRQVEKYKDQYRLTAIDIS